MDVTTSHRSTGTDRRTNARRRPWTLLILLAAAPGPSCAERAHADPAASSSSERTSATDLAVVVESPAGDRVELHAESARLEPGFPQELAGAFDSASLAVSPPPAASPPAEAAKESPDDAAADLDSFSVNARRMRYDSRGGRASFSGEVRVTLGEMRLGCDVLEVTYHRAEGTVDFIASGSVRVERPGIVATAGKAQYEGAARALTLTESPRVEGDVGVLEGSRIVLDADDETVTVEEVRGTFRVHGP